MINPKELFGKDYEEFCEVDPFNPQNEVDGIMPELCPHCREQTTAVPHRTVTEEELITEYACGKCSKTMQVGIQKKKRRTPWN